MRRGKGTEGNRVIEITREREREGERVRDRERQRQRQIDRHTDRVTENSRMAKQKTSRGKYIRKPE